MRSLRPVDPARLRLQRASRVFVIAVLLTLPGARHAAAGAVTAAEARAVVATRTPSGGIY
jgi:hypothetical protein